MADAIEVQLAQAIVAEINAATWTLPFTAVRTWAPWSDEQDLTSLVVYVLPLILPLSRRESRGRTWSFEYGFEVNFQQEVPLADGRPDQATVDGLCAQVEAVMDFYRDNHLIVAAGEWFAKGVERPMLFAPDRLWKDHVFETWLELTIRGER